MREDYYLEAKKNGWSLSDLVEIGFEVRKQLQVSTQREVNQIKERIEDLQTFNSIWKEKYIKLSNEMFHIKEKVSELPKENLLTNESL